MGEQNRHGLITSRNVIELNGTSAEDATVRLNSAGRIGETLHDLSRNGERNGSKGQVFTPHPPESRKESHSTRSPRGLKSPKRFERKLQRKHSYESSSDDEVKLGERSVSINRSKLPPLRKSGNESVGFNGGELGSINNDRPLVPNLKSLAPLKDQKQLVEDFKFNQSAQKERFHEPDRTTKGPVRPLPTNEVSSNMVLNKQTLKKDENLKHSIPDVNNLEADVSENTLTSVSSDASGSSLDTDSDSESDRTKVKDLSDKFKPGPPNSVPSLRSNQHHSLSLTSVSDSSKPTGTYSDSEALHRERKAKRKSTRELWNKAKIVSYLPKVPASKARDRNSNFVQEELEKYLPERKLMVFVGTWNMHGEKHLPVFVDDLLLPECCQYMQDLYVIGSQESTPLRKEWEIKLQEALGPSHVMIYSCAFGVLHVAMFLRRELVWFCSAVQQATVATRPGHMIKTKGAVGLSLSIFGTSFLFINSHFAAHEPKWKERISNYRLIRRTLSLPLNYSESPSRSTDVTSRFEQVFWFGDFNFRVSERREVVEKFLSRCEEVEDPNYDELISKDQMTKLMNKDGGVFEHFKECPINFPPTYKFDINPENPGQYSTLRVPSWTDRIVYRSKVEDDIKPLYYDHCTSLINSDHRPVYGIFEASIKPIKERVSFTGVHFVRDVYIEANRRRASPPRNQNQTSVCTIL